MLSLFAAIAIANPPHWPRYQAKFVDLSAVEYNKNFVVYDAKPDLSIAGYTYVAMIDVAPASPLTVIGGIPRSMWKQSGASEEKTYWAYRILGRNRIAAFYANYPSLDRPREGKWVLLKTRGEKLVSPSPSRPLPCVQAIRKFDQFTPMGKVPGCLLPEVKRRSTAGYEDRCDIAATAMGQGFELANVTFYPITPGYDTCMHDAEQQSAYVRAGSTYRSLTECFSAKGYELQEIVWASKQGWLVVDAKYNGRAGLVWLTPVG